MKRINFNDDWLFAEGSGSALAMLGGVQAAVPAMVTLPYDDVIHTERTDFPLGNGTGFFKGRNVNYTKNFFAEESWKDKEILIEFEGIYQNAFIYVNNAYVGRVNHGYVNYHFNISKFLNYGAKNQIKVIIKNDVFSGRWYTGGGIYRDVTLLIGDPLHIDIYGSRIMTLELDQDQAVMRIITPLRYTGRHLRDVRIRTRIFDNDNTLVGQDSCPVTIFPNEGREIRQQIVVANPMPWSVDTPYLYRCQVDILENDQIIDTFSDQIGIRRITLDTSHGLRINGETVKLRGGCIHHDYGILGSASFPEAAERRIRILKEAGYNAIRISHHPAGSTVLKACDKYGMLVMDEFTDAWTTAKTDYDYGFHFDESWEHDVENMIRLDFNHPCVILYSIGNEIPETGNKIDVNWGRKIAEKIRSIDDTRYTINCVNLMLSAMGHMDEIMASLNVDDHGQPREINSMMASFADVLPLLTGHEITTAITEEAFSQVDVSGYNYAAGRYEQDLERFPNRIMLGSETYAASLEENWELVEKHPRILGDFVWTAWDYLGEAGVGQITYGEPIGGFYGSYPWKTANVGTIDLIGDRQPVSYWREIIWGLRTSPYLVVQPPKHFGKQRNLSPWAWTDGIHSWSWQGWEGKKTTVEVYSPDEEVELFLNGKSIGRKKTGGKHKYLAEFEVAYTPGTLEVVSCADPDKKDCLKTSAGEQILSLQSSGNIKRDKGIAYVSIGVTDLNGIPCMQSDRRITVTVEGDGCLQGLGSADPAGQDNFFENTCRLYHGKALAAVRATKAGGRIQVTVTSDDLPASSVEILVQEH